MALTRKFLKAMGIEDDKIEEIITNHSETVQGLKEEIDKYKSDAEKLPSIQAELTKAKELAKEVDKDAYKVKYDALKEEFEGYKTEVTTKETTATKTKAYKELLKELNISDKIIDKVVKLADINALEIVDGKIKDADTLSTNLKEEWGDFIVTSNTKGAGVDTPPAKQIETDPTKMDYSQYKEWRKNN